MWVLAPPLSSGCLRSGAKPARICHEGVGVKDLHHFSLYTFVPHRLSNPLTHALYALGACMSLHVVVVHSCKLQGHIKHEWEGYLGDVGQRCKAKSGEDPELPPLRDKSVRAWLPKVDKHCLMARQVPIAIISL